VFVKRDNDLFLLPIKKTFFYLYQFVYNLDKCMFTCNLKANMKSKLQVVKAQIHTCTELEMASSKQCNVPLSNNIYKLEVSYKSL